MLVKFSIATIDIHNHNSKFIDHNIIIFFIVSICLYCFQHISMYNMSCSGIFTMVAELEDNSIGRQDYIIFSFLKLLFYPLKLRLPFLKMVYGLKTTSPLKFYLNSKTHMWKPLREF